MNPHHPRDYPSLSGCTQRIFISTLSTIYWRISTSSSSSPSLSAALHLQDYPHPPHLQCPPPLQHAPHSIPHTSISAAQLCLLIVFNCLHPQQYCYQHPTKYIRRRHRSTRDTACTPLPPKRIPIRSRHPIFVQRSFCTVRPTPTESTAPQFVLNQPTYTDIWTDLSRLHAPRRAAAAYSCRLLSTSRHSLRSSTTTTRIFRQ